MLELGLSSWDLAFEAGIWTLRPGYGLQGFDLGFMAGIWALRPRCGPQVLDLSLEAGTWASGIGMKARYEVNIAFNRNGNIAHIRWIVTKLAVGSMEEECRSSSDKSDCDTDKELDKAG